MRLSIHQHFEKIVRQMTNELGEPDPETLASARRLFDAGVEAAASIVEFETKHLVGGGGVSSGSAIAKLLRSTAIQDSSKAAETVRKSGLSGLRDRSSEAGNASPQSERPGGGDSLPENDSPGLAASTQTAETMEDMATRVANEAAMPVIRSMYPSLSRGQMANEFRHFIITGALWQRAQAAPAARQDVPTDKLCEYCTCEACWDKRQPRQVSRPGGKE